MQGDDICALQNGIGRISQFYLELIGPGLGQKGIEGHNLHVEPLRPLDELAPDPAPADYGEPFAIEFDAGEGLASGLEFTLQDLGMSRGNIAGGSEHESKGMFGSRNGVTSRGIHHDHPLCACGFPVDIVDAHPGPADGPEPGSPRDYFCVGLGLGTYNEGVIVPDDFQKLFRLGAEIRNEVGGNVGVLVQEGDPMLTDGVRDKDTVTGHLLGRPLCQKGKKGKDW